MELIFNQNYQFYIPLQPGDTFRRTWYGKYVGTFKEGPTVCLLFLVDNSESAFGVSCFESETKEGPTDFVAQIKQYYYRVGECVDLTQKFFSRDKNDVIRRYTLKDKMYAILIKKYK